MSVYSDHAYRKRTAALRRRAARNNEPCCMCGKPIDYSLPSHDRWGFTAEHYEQPLSLGGNLLGPIAPCHRACNSSHGNGTRTKGDKPSKPSGPIPEVKRPMRW